MNKKKVIPIIIIEIYLILTLLLYEFGPIQYPTQNYLLLYLFVIVYQIMLFIGYIYALKKQKKEEKRNEININIVNKIILASLIMSIFFSIMWMVRYSDSFSLIDIIKNIVNGIVDPGTAYSKNMSMNNEAQIGGRYITVLSTILVGFYYIGIPLGVYCFKDMKLLNKILLFVAIILEISTYIMKGTNIGIFRVGISIVSVLIIKWYSNRENKKAKLKREKIIKISLIILTLFIIIFYFTYSTTDRMNNTLPQSIYHIPINYENLVLKMLPDNIKYGFIMITSYLSQGYYGMSLAFNYDFESTFGFGNSTFLTQNIEEIFNIDIYERTYQSKMSYIWNDRVNWHTAYTWFANDITFIGVIPLMFIIGFMIYKTISEAKNNNLFAVALLPLYMSLLIFLPANNSMLSNPMTFMPFVLLHIGWFLSKKKKVWRLKNEK